TVSAVRRWPPPTTEPVDEAEARERGMPDWREILSRDGPAVWRTAYRLLGNRADADEGFQEAVRGAWEGSRRGEGQDWRGRRRRGGSGGGGWPRPGRWTGPGGGGDGGSRSRCPTGTSSRGLRLPPRGAPRRPSSPSGSEAPWRGSPRSRRRRSACTAWRGG